MLSANQLIHVRKFLALVVTCIILVLQCHMLKVFLDGKRMRGTDTFLGWLLWINLRNS